MNISNLIAGLGSIFAGVQALKGTTSTSIDTPASVGVPIRTVRADGMTTKIYTSHSIRDRVGHIVTMIKRGRDNPRVRKIAASVLSRKCDGQWCTPEKNWSAEVVAIFNAVRKNVRYTRDPVNVDLFQHPLRALEMASGDCDDVSIVLAALLQSVGYPVRLRVIRTRDSADWSHIYVLVGLPPRQPGRWVALDASVDQPAGWQAPRSMVAAVKDFAVD